MYVPSFSVSYAGVIRSGLERRIEEILNARIRSLTVWRKLVLLVVGLMAVVVPVTVGVTDASPRNLPLPQLIGDLDEGAALRVSGQVRDAVAALSNPERAPTAAAIPSQPRPAGPPVSQQDESQAGELEDTVLGVWLQEDVAYLITVEERATFRALQTDEERFRFIEQFWLQRDPTPETIENEYRLGLYRRIEEANEQFGYAETPGWQADRGRIYILYGEPDGEEAYPTGGVYERRTWEGGGTTLVFPFERWWYEQIEGIGQEITFEFVDPSLSGEYRLAISPSEKEVLETGAVQSPDPRQETGEESAVQSMRFLNTASVTHLFSSGEYATDLRTLVEEFDLDPALLEVKDGYRFEYTPIGDSGYELTAEPVRGTWRHFFSGTDGIIRVEEGRTATLDSPPVR